MICMFQLCCEPRVIVWVVEKFLWICDSINEFGLCVPLSSMGRVRPGRGLGSAARTPVVPAACNGCGQHGSS